MDFRSFFKPAGTNPEIEGPFYELSSFALIVGHFNFEALTLGFKKGSSITELTFRPIDPTKPIVLAVDNMTDIGFLYIDHHLEDDAEAGMRNYKVHKTDEFLIDCKRRDILGDGREYWSVKSEGMTFVYSDVDFPETCHLFDADPLCEFVAGEMTANQLRAVAYLSAREAEKEERREKHIQELAKALKEAQSECRGLRLKDRVASGSQERLKALLGKGRLPWVLKSSVKDEMEPRVTPLDMILSS